MFHKASRTSWVWCAYLGWPCTKVQIHWLSNSIQATNTPRNVAEGLKNLKGLHMWVNPPMHQVAGMINTAQKKAPGSAVSQPEDQIRSNALAWGFLCYNWKIGITDWTGKIISFTEGFAHPEQSYSFKILMKNWWNRSTQARGIQGVANNCDCGWWHLYSLPSAKNELQGGMGGTAWLVCWHIIDPSTDHVMDMWVLFFLQPLGSDLDHF